MAGDPARIKMSTSVVIATYSRDRFADLAAAVASVQNQTVTAHQIIVAVDRNPKLAEKVAAELPSVTVVENTQHAGAGGARNSGAAVGTGEYVAFLDDDAIAAPDWIDQIEHALCAEDVIGVGGLVEPLWLIPQPDWFPLEFAWVVGCSYTGLPEERSAVRNVFSGNMAMRAALFEELGGFLDEYGKTGDRAEPEETELCIRAGQRWPDRRWIYEPAMRIQHRVPASRLRIQYFLRRCLSEGIGKATLAGHVGSQDALRSERSYVRAVLPAGVARGLHDCVRHGDAHGGLRAAAIGAGSFVAAAGYATARGRAQFRSTLSPRLRGATAS